MDSLDRAKREYGSRDDVPCGCRAEPAIPHRAAVSAARRTLFPIKQTAGLRPYRVSGQRGNAAQLFPTKQTKGFRLLRATQVSLPSKFPLPSSDLFFHGKTKATKKPFTTAVFSVFPVRGDIWRECAPSFSRRRASGSRTLRGVHTHRFPPFLPPRF